MPVFEYTAVNTEGATVKGTAFGQSLDAVASELAQRGLSVQSLGMAVDSDGRPMSGELPVAEAKPAPPTEARSAFETQVVGQVVNVVPLQALAFMFRQLGTLLNAGINPVDALETLSRQTTSPKLSSILRETKDHALAGRPISAGFQRYPEVFSPLMMSLVRVGEEGGFMPEQCTQISEYLTRDIELRNMIKRETAMPKITVGFSIVIILGTNALIQAIAPGGLGLPTPWLVWFLALGTWVGWTMFKKFGLPQQPVRYKFHKFVLGLPGLGPMLHMFAMAKFGRAFGALYRGGVAMPKAVGLAADACDNEFLRAQIHPAADRLEQGAPITETFAATGAFSPLVLDMTRTGEMTGNMDQMLVKMSEYYEDEGKTQASIAVKIVGVVCFIIVAIYVLFVLFTFYSSYFGRLGSAGA